MNALSNLETLPSGLAGFRDLHAGQTMVVCGCGASLNDLTEPERYLTVGVNDVGRRFDPDYLVVLNSAPQFSGDRFKYVAESRARVVFSHLRLDLKHARHVGFPLGRRAGVDLSDPNSLPYTRNSPYVALALAAHMGARRIGVIGVDFTPNHFFGATGTHPLAREFAQIDREYELFGRALAERGVEVFDLSVGGRLTAFPKMSPDEFAGLSKGARSMQVVSYATTPVAGVPPVLARCIEARTVHRARTVWATDDYGNGVRFDGDVEWSRRPREADDLIAKADLVVAHNGRIDKRHARAVAAKPTLVMAHNYMWNVDNALVRAGAPGLVVGQYQAAEPEFAGWTAVPNPVPLWEAAYSPEPKGERIVIAYTPSGKHESYPRGHSLYWHGKGYRTTMAILARLAERHDIELAVIGGEQVSHAQSLAMKRRAHIVIDECVTGSYHRNSLEGLASGALVVNGLGLVPAISEVFRRMAPDAASAPFEMASLDTLETTLMGLIESGSAELAARGAENRRWMERHWSFGDQWRRFWLPAVERALEVTGRAPARRPVVAEPAPVPIDPAQVPAGATPPEPLAAAAVPTAVTVVIPHGGAERLPLLDSVLARLGRQGEAARVVVVEMDPHPTAADACARHGALHVPVREPFQKARAMNVGLGFVDTSHLLWLDNDLLLPDGFLGAALAEGEQRNLDCLVPWHTVRYLSQADSERVRAGQAQAETCHPVRLFHSRGVWGGAVLVRTAFALRYGGMCEHYRGYGQEDVGWFSKAGLLGRAAVTRAADRTLHHLYHSASGGYGGPNPSVDNPHFQENLALTHRIRGLRSARAFLTAFPAPAHPPAPWCGAACVADTAAGRDVTQALVALFGEAAVELCPPGHPGAVRCPAPAAGQTPRDAARALALRIAALAPPATPATSPYARQTPVPAMTYAQATHVKLPEAQAFNAGRQYPRMRQWELPFALAQGRFGPSDRVLDCSINPCGFGDRLAELHPGLAYRHLPAIDAKETFAPPVGAPDGSADRIVCVNTLEHLLAAQRARLMQEMARLLRPGGRLVITVDQYPEDFWKRPALRKMGVLRSDGQEVFNGWNRASGEELAGLAEAAGLTAAAPLPDIADAAATGLWRNEEPYPHTTLGLVFEKPGAAAFAPCDVVLCVVAPDGPAPAAALSAAADEAAMLERFGHRARVLLSEGTAPQPMDHEAVATLGDRLLRLHAAGDDALDRAAAEAIAQGAEAVLLIDADLVAAPGLAHALLCRLLGSSSGVAAVVAGDPREPAAALQPRLGVDVQAADTARWTGCALVRASAVRGGLRLSGGQVADADGRPFTVLQAEGGALRRLAPEALAAAPRPASPALTSPATVASPSAGSPATSPAASASTRRPEVDRAAPAVVMARAGDLALPEFAAFNRSRNYPRMRQWELPFALAHLRLDSGMSVLDCSHNPQDLAGRLRELYPELDYSHQPLLAGATYAPLAEDGPPVDRALCVNVLEHLEPEQRRAAVGALARRLKPGGRLVVTCDYYFDALLEDPRLVDLGVVRLDRTPFVGGWNKVTPAELLALGREHGLEPALGGGAPAEPSADDAGLYRNVAAYPHATLGCVFVKPGVEAAVMPQRRMVLSLLSWNTRQVSVEAAQALLREAAMLQRFGHEAAVCICDNGSSDGAPAAFRDLAVEPGVTLHVIENVENRGNCVGRNQIIDFMKAWNGDYLLFDDGDIEIVPFSTFAMMRHMEGPGRGLGCLGAWSSGYRGDRARTTASLFSLKGMQFVDTQMIAFTQYGLFRRAIFDDGVRLDDSGVFSGAGWGFEDNDLAFQMVSKGYGIQFFKGITYLHRDANSSVPIMRRHGHDPNVLVRKRKEHVLRKWADVPAIAEGPLAYLRTVNITL